MPGFKELEAGLQTIGPPILSSKRHVSRSISAHFLHNPTVTIYYLIVDGKRTSKGGLYATTNGQANEMS